MVSELIRRATRQEYEMQDKNLDPDTDEISGCRDNDPVTELRFGTVAIPADIAFSETENNEAPSTQASQISLTQEDDEHIRRLDRSGALVQIVGSQSLLSQELVDYSQKNEPLLSQPAADTTSMAKKLGLLAEEDEAGDEDDDGQAAAIPSSSDEDDGLPTTLTQANDASQISLVLSQSFGTLLSAAQAFHEQEEVAKQQSAEDLPAFMAEYHDPRLVPKEGFDDPSRRRSRRAQAKLPTRKQPKPIVTPKPRKLAEASPNETSVPSKKRKQVQPIVASAKKAKPTVNTSKAVVARVEPQPAATTARSKAQLMAKQAAELAEQAITNPEVAKRLLLTMALVRVNPRSAPEKMPGKGHVIAEGFHWAQYPPLEGVLKDHMATYYDLSTRSCQSAQQQTFNNRLVKLVRQAADKQGWLFYDSFTDKVLRDRVRCYYKTHIQNAKKRLNTMVRNPTKKANARHLVQHLHIIKAVKEIRLEGSNPGQDNDNPDARPNEVVSKDEENADSEGVVSNDDEHSDSEGVVSKDDEHSDTEGARLKEEDHSESDEEEGDSASNDDDSGIVAEV